MLERQIRPGASAARWSTTGIAGEAAGIPVGTLHILRHTAATLMLSSGVPIHVAAARLGDRPETILKVYAHLLPNSDEQAAVGMAELIAAAR